MSTMAVRQQHAVPLGDVQCYLYNSTNAENFNKLKISSGIEVQGRTALSNLSNVNLGCLGSGPQKPAKLSSTQRLQVYQPLISEQTQAYDQSRPSWYDFDAVHKDNVLANSEYAPYIFRYLREVECKNRPLPNYIACIQDDMTANMRSILVDWLVEVGQEYKMDGETIHLTINLLDRFLSVRKVDRGNLQLAGVASLWIASKYEEIYPPTAGQLCHITDNTYTKDEIIKMEELILSTLKYEITVPSPKVFIQRLVQVSEEDKQFECLALYLAEQTLLEERMLGFLPSCIAASAVYLAGVLLRRKTPWTGMMEHYSGYHSRQLMDCVENISTIHQSNHDSSNYPALVEKYTHINFMCVSKIPPLRKHRVTTR